MPPHAPDELIRAWPGAVLVASPRGIVRVINEAARRLLGVADGSSGEGVDLADVFGKEAVAALLPADAETGECRIGEDAATTAVPVLRARSARLAGGDFLLRLDDASDEHRLKSHLEHAERLASVGELLSSVAHELSNPLTTVLGYADLILSEGNDRLQREEIERIRAEAMRCRRIVGNLLDLARAETLDIRPLSIALVVDKVLEFRTYAAQVAEVELVREAFGDLPAVNADHHRLVQAVLNLVTNAEDAVKSSRETGRRIVLRTRATQTGVAIEVEDNGPGVPAAIREYVFEPFFTTKPRGRGTGLGLSLVRATAEAHGGTVRVADAPGGGAVFTIELPAAQ